MIHPTATIESGAQIAQGVEIGPYCYLSAETKLMSGVTLDSHVEIRGKVSIGEQTHLYPFSRIGDGTVEQITIGSHCHIREFTEIGIGSNTPLPIHIAEGCYIMAHTHIDAGVTLERDCTITIAATLQQGCTCQERVIVAAKATVGEGCVIGKGSMIAAASTVTHTVPPFSLVEGDPIAEIRGLNLVGMRRAFESRESISHVKHAFMLLKKAGFDTAYASTLLEKTDDIHAKALLAFACQYPIVLPTHQD